MPPPGLLAGHPFSSERREKAASASGTLANNFPANADLEATALHRPGEWASQRLASSPAKAVFFGDLSSLPRSLHHATYDLSRLSSHSSQSRQSVSRARFHAIHFSAGFRHHPFECDSPPARSVACSSWRITRMAMASIAALPTGATCGAAIATAYCRSREFSQAVCYRKVNEDAITERPPWPRPAATRAICDDQVAIECTALIASHRDTKGPSPKRSLRDRFGTCPAKIGTD